MGEKTPATTTTQSQSQPWAPATGLLQQLISKYGGMNTDVTGGQQAALNNLQTSAAGIPNFGGAAAAGVNKLFGSDNSNQIGMLNSGYNDLKTNLGGTASGAELDPYSTPGFSDAISTMTGDITKATKGVFAGSGRDPSGAGSFSGSLGRGLTQGIAPVIQAQYNTNKSNQMGASKSLFDAAGSTASGISQQKQLEMANIMQGLQGAGMIPGISMGPAQMQLAAANAGYNQQFDNLSKLLTPAMGMGALGTQQSGTGTQTPANDPLSNWLGGITAGAGWLFSDERVKEDIERVGKLDDGQNVYSYRYKGDNTPQIGLLAQEVLEHEPEAVHDVGGVLAVDYSLATRRARNFGRVGMMEAA